MILEDNIQKDEFENEEKEGKKFPVKTVIIIGVALALCAAVVLLGIFVFKPMLARNSAKSLAEKGDLAEAFEKYDRIADDEKALDQKLALQRQVIDSRSTEELKLGKYDWLVLEERDGKALIVTKDIISQLVYHGTLEDVTWEDCSLRAYLNGTFLNEFSAEEKARIVPTTIKNTNNPEYNVKNGKDTKDSVFLLSLEEANLYFPDNASRAAMFQHSYGWWWLRSAGLQENLAAIVTSDGSIAYAGSGVNYSNRGVRPAMWVEMP